MPQIGLSLLCIEIDDSALGKIREQIATLVLHSLGVNNNYPHGITFLDMEYMSLKVPYLGMYIATEK